MDGKVFPALITLGSEGPGGRGAVMTATLDGVTTKKPDTSAEAEAARELVRLAK